MTMTFGSHGAMTIVVSFCGRKGSGFGGNCDSLLSAGGLGLGL